MHYLDDCYSLTVFVDVVISEGLRLHLDRFYAKGLFHCSSE